MGIYYYAVDEKKKLKFESPRDFSIKSPGFYHYENPFACMILMKNHQGFDFQLCNDSTTAYEYHCEREYKDITEEVFQEYLNEFPELKIDLIKEGQ